MCAYASILKVLGRLREEEKLFSLRQNKIHVGLVMSQNLTRHKQPKLWWELLWEAEISSTSFITFRNVKFIYNPKQR